MIEGKAPPESQMKILRISETTLLVIAFTIAAHAQEIASKDLLRPPIAVTATAPAQAEEKPEYPDGCSKMGVGYADGVTLGKAKYLGNLESSWSKSVVRN